MRRGQLARITGAIAVLMVLAAGAAMAADTPDAWVTMKTKVALMTTEGIGTSDLNVDTVKGIVTLHGKVATEAEKAKAETVARGIDGAKEVKNLLQVVPSAQRAVVERADDEIKAAVDAAFKANTRVNTSGITRRIGEQGRRPAVGEDEVSRGAPGSGPGRQRRSRRATCLDGSRTDTRLLNPEFTRDLHSAQLSRSGSKG